MELWTGKREPSSGASIGLGVRSSAMLSEEAFDLAAETDYHVDDLKPWKAQRLFYNTSWWYRNFVRAFINMGAI